MERLEGNSVAGSRPGSRAPSFNCDEGDKFFSRMRSRDFGAAAAAAAGGGAAKSEGGGKNSSTSAAQIPFDWEAAPGKPKKEEERSTGPPPLSPPPMMTSPAVSRTPSFASDKWRANSIRVPSKQNSQNAMHLKGKLSNMQSFSKVAQTAENNKNSDKNSRPKRSHSKSRSEREKVSKTGCNPFGRSGCFKA